MLIPLQPHSQCIFLLEEEGKKEALENFKHVIEICPNRVHVIKNILQNTWTIILRMLFKVLLDKHRFVWARTYSHVPLL